MSQTNTKEFILDVAQDLIQRLGVNGMSYQDISKEVGIKKASVHTHFPKKNDLLIALLDRFSDRFYRTMDKIIASGDSPEVKLQRYCGLFEATLSSGNQDKACLCGMLGAEFASLDAATLERVRDFYQANEAKIATLLAQGKQDESFRFPGEVPAMAAMIFSLVQGGLLVARVRGGVAYFQQITDQITILVKN